MDANKPITNKEIVQVFVDPQLAARFPPILTTQQAAELLQVPCATIYTWKSRGLLNGCCRKMGKHLRFFRDRLILHLFSENSNHE